MARNFAGVPTFPYIGQPYSVALPELGSTARWVPIFIDWRIYGAATDQPNTAVSLNLLNIPAGIQMQRIRSVRIDNTNSSVPIYVYFPDTQYMVVAPPDTIVQENVITSGQLVLIVGEGFTDGDIPATTIFFSNIALTTVFDPELSQALALWKASASISRGNTIYNSNFGVPALGDQTVQYFNNVGGVGIFQNNLWGTPLANGFVYLTNIEVQVITAAGTAGTTATWQIESAAGDVLYKFEFSTEVSTNGPFPIYGPMSAMNIKLDATTTWRLNCTQYSLGALRLAHFLNFTTNPN